MNTINLPLTDDQLVELERDLRQNNFKERGIPEDTVITCKTCEARRTCMFSFDAYNTDGDCLADK